MDEDRVAELMQAFVSGAVTEDEAREINGLAGQEGMGSELAWQWTVHRLLQQAARPRVDAGRIVASLPSHSVGDHVMTAMMARNFGRPQRSRRARWTFAAVGAAGLLAAAVVLMVARSDRAQKNTVQPEIAARHGVTEPGAAGEDPASVAVNDAPGAIVALAETGGAVQIVTKDGAGPALTGRVLTAGDAVRSGAGGWAQVVGPHHARVTLAENTDYAVEVQLDTSLPQTVNALLRAGTADVDLPGGRTKSFAIATPLAQLTSQRARFSLTASPGSTRVRVFDGSVQLERRSTGQSIEVGAHRQALLAAGSDEGSDLVATAMPPVSALLVVGAEPSSGDQLIKARLESQGFAVTMRSDDQSTPRDAQGKTIVVITSGTESTLLSHDFRDVPVAMLVAEPWLFDDLRFAPSGDDALLEGKNIRVVAAGHPLAAGLNGSPNISTSTIKLNFGRPYPSALVIATAPGGGQERPVIFAYEQGAPLGDFIAPARRVGFFLNEGGAALLTSAGWSLFDAAVRWCAGGQGGVAGQAGGAGHDVAGTKVDAAPTDAAPFSVKRFKIFSALNYRNQPDLSPLGLEKITVIPESQLIPANWSAVAPEKVVRLQAGRAAAAKAPVAIDIEQWELDPELALPTGVNNAIAWYNGTMDLWRKYGAGVPVGWFGIVPIRNYRDAAAGSGSPGYGKWQAANDQVKSIADRADILFPSVYTFRNDPGTWVSYAVETIREARRLAGGKPVIPFIWCEYHQKSPGDASGPIDGAFWRVQLETMRKHADGVVLWGGYLRTWDENAPWWQATKEFLQILQR